MSRVRRAHILYRELHLRRYKLTCTHKWFVSDYINPRSLESRVKRRSHRRRSRDVTIIEDANSWTGCLTLHSSSLTLLLSKCLNLKHGLKQFVRSSHHALVWFLSLSHYVAHRSSLRYDSNWMLPVIVDEDVSWILASDLDAQRLGHQVPLLLQSWYPRTAHILYFEVRCRRSVWATKIIICPDLWLAGLSRQELLDARRDFLLMDRIYTRRIYDPNLDLI